MNTRFYTILATLLFTVATASAQVKIYGNVYGGGEKAQVIAPDIETVKAQLIQDADLTTLFNNNRHIYTTYVRLGEKAEVYGRTFGGGMGHEDSQGESAGRVTGQTDVVLDGATVWSEIFGGGQNADVRGNTLLHFKKGKAGHNAFGGGLGLLGGTDATPDNQRIPLASADIKLVPNNYTLITEDNATNLAALKALSLDNASNWIEKTGESFVIFDGTEESYTHYEFEKARTFKVVDGKPVVTETNQYNPSNPSQLFSINHNIYGGGMTASKIEGKTFVHINYGMVNEEMMNYEVDGEKVWSKVYNSIANAQFCVFGGGYGYHSQVNGDTYVTMDIMGSGAYKYITEFTNWFAGEGKRKYGWDTNTGDPQAIYNAADESTWSHGAPGRSCMDVIGGGYNGKVLGSTNITIGGDVIVRKVYGGGYYASVGNTNVNIKSGIFNRVYGGGLIGNVYGKANLTIGQQGNTDDIIKHNTHLMVKDAIYGGNDVSGTVGTVASTGTGVTNGQVTNYGITYNVYNPQDADDKGVRLNIYGGLILGDVYGAGNGNHPGYGNPNYMEFNLSQHPSENYRRVLKEGKAAGSDLTNAGNYAYVYKYRPRTGRVVMNLQGNAGTDFNDIPTVDKVRIWGRTFGGGNSCNVGIWDGSKDDTAEKYADDATSWHPGDNFQGQGTITLNIGSHVQLGNRDDSHEKPNGLFMGCNGEHMVTQHLDKDKARYYHQFYDPKNKKYYPGFVVYETAESTRPIKRTTGLKAFTAFINNILTKSDNVKLNIANDVQDVWMSNFVGGGYRGSMQAATANGRFAYALPKGVTIGHAVVGGAFNAHIIYRVYATNYTTGEFAVDSNGNYLYETVEPTGGVKSKDDVGKGEDYDYIKKLYEEGHEGDEAYKTGYLRYNFDGGMMGHESGPVAVANGVRCGQVKADGKLDFTTSKSGDSSKKFDMSKALVYLDLRNRMEPIVETKTVNDVTKKTVHGGIVYGGCFATGYVDGDSWVDYRCSLSPLCTDEEFFDKTKPELYEKVDNIADYNALNVYGAGYGVDSHVMGDAYLRILHNGSSDNTYDYPLIYNAFGGGNNGTVAGNTNVYFNVGGKGTVLGSLYAGGYHGEIGGNTKLELAGGLIINAYGGSREADIKGASHVWAYDGQMRPTGEDETSPEHAPLLIGNLYGGNDISGTINGSKDATWTETRWNATATSDKQWSSKKFTSYVQIGGTEGSTRGYPMVGNVFAGGNGINTKSPATAPDVATALLEVDGGTVLRAFGGGNKATVTTDACIFVDANDDTFATFTFSDYQKTVINHTVLNNINSGYKWIGNELRLDPYHIVKLYGGNNLAPMAIQPAWNLAKGSLENVYSGGNLGDMTHPQGIHIDVTSANITIKNLFGGCRMADVKPTAIAGQEAEFNTYWSDTRNYGATVNCIGGYIGNVYGGNDISGTVAHGTKVVIDGAVDNDVYCAGNGNYLYKWDADVTQVTEVKEGDDVIYKVPAMDMFGGAEANATQKLLTINAYRPSVDRSALDIEGAEESVQDQQDPAIKVAFVKGNVYCGGNASTVTGKSATDLTIGSHVNIHGLFMGSDGYDYSQQEAIAKFEKLNGFDMTEETNFTGLIYGDGEGQVPATLMTAAEEQYYPTLVALYMKSVEMESLPIMHIANDVTNAYIGTWCGGGNRGSMTTQQPVVVTIPSNITIYDKVVAGCMDAHLKYVGKSTIEDVGGYYRPLTSGSTKLNYTVNAKFLPRYMSVPTGMDAEHRNPEGDDFFTARGKYFLYVNKTGEGATAQYNIGNNIYGGCYEAGDILGDVVLNVNSNLLEEPLTHREMLNNTSRNEVAAFNVYGAGMGMESNVWGNVTINMTGNANNVYGGGRSGTLIGNATINMKNGIVYRHIIGGSDAGNMYGSTQIAVGKPTVYKSPVTAEYTLTRADEGLSNKIKLAQGDLISEALYDMITGDKSGFTPETSTHDLTSIYIGGGIYGGGYALATGSTVFAGSTTVYKYTAEKCPRNPNTGELTPSLTGYGGNATIMIKDNDATDNITISTIVPTVKKGMQSTMGYFTRGAAKANPTAVGDTEYAWNHQPDAEPVGGTTYYDLTGQGGVFGDGHLSFVEGFRSADIVGYGYATYTPQQPKLLNTMQRLDVARIKDCCIMLQGARDFATNSTDATNYSVSRIRELQLGSSINTETLAPGSASSVSADSQHTTPKMRNYVGLYKNVHFLGALKSDVAFTDDRFNETGTKTAGTSYQAFKSDIISNNYPANSQDKINTFRTRNLGTAKNMIGINNGYTLKIQKETADNTTVTYGPVIGVTEVKLLTLVRGEGGGYVYAANKHSDTNNFLNTSGNLVFQSTGTGSDTQYIVDDCFPAGFSETAQGNCHYWYVEGDRFWFNGTITGYTYDDGELKFNLNNQDQIISLSGTKSGSSLTIQSIEWQHVHSGSPYSCDIEYKLNDGYAFSLSASNDATYNTTGAYSADMAVGALTGTANTDDPRLAIQLTDNVKNNAATYYDQHLKEPCKAKIVLTSSNGKTYTMNLEVVYLKGPSVEGTVVIDNCALPGEYIHAHVAGLKIETNDGMPVTGTKWQVKHDDTTEEVARMNTTEIDNSIIDLKALYKHNGYQLQYVVVANGVDFPVSVANDATMKTLTVHNYHKMADVQARQSNTALQLDPNSGARIYINNEEDLRAFGQWINNGGITEGVHFHLQNSLALPADWNITGTFAGTLHGDGYVLDASAVTGTKTLFGANYDNEHAKVYNLGVAGGTIASVSEGSPSGITNSFDSNDTEADLKYGKKAYTLSHFHNATTNATYVNDYYTGDDWRYARTTADNTSGKEYLRTGAPAYGSVHTAHIIKNNLTAYIPVEHDYLFFGQTLKPSGDQHPVHIVSDETNRVFETEGYYNSKNDEKFYYNTAAAWAMQPGLTAIRFDNTKESGEQQKPAAIGATEDVTRNLLIYEADNAIVDHFSESFFHVKGSKPDSETQNVFRLDNMALVDMQDFNAPYAFTAQAASYVRTPTNFVETPGTAWESICLPFSPSKTTLSHGIFLYPYDNDSEWTKGNPTPKEDITFFYGDSEDYNTGNHIRHEYWLRELKSIEETEGSTTATFVRPSENTFVAYKPYIVSFPGARFYEFNMTGQTITFSGTNAVVTVTDDATTKTVTKDNYTYTGAFAHEDATEKYVLNVNDAEASLRGSKFVACSNDTPVLPFRGWMSKPVSSAKSRAIYIGGTLENAPEDLDDEEHPSEPLYPDITPQMKAYTINHSIIIESTYDADLRIYTSAGQLSRAVHVLQGENFYTGFAPGVYIVNGKKLVVR